MCTKKDKRWKEKISYLCERMCNQYRIWYTQIAHVWHVELPQIVLTTTHHKWQTYTDLCHLSNAYMMSRQNTSHASLHHPWRERQSKTSFPNRISRAIVQRASRFRCSKKFLWEFDERTTIVDDAYLLYCRCNNVKYRHHLELMSQCR